MTVPLRALAAVQAPVAISEGVSEER
jgi:hypothetical protein